MKRLTKWIHESVFRDFPGYPYEVFKVPPTPKQKRKYNVQDVRVVRVYPTGDFFGWVLVYVQFGRKTNRYEYVLREGGPRGQYRHKLAYIVQYLVEEYDSRNMN